VLVGPSLAGIGTRAAERIADPTYKGSAKTADDYIRESILTPNQWVVPGPTYSAGGQSVMPPYGDILKTEDIDHLVAYLATFK